MLKALATSLAVFTTAQAAQLTLSQALKEALAQNPAYQAAQNDVVLAEIGAGANLDQGQWDAAGIGDAMRDTARRVVQRELAPLLERVDGFTYLLCRTSNPESAEFQELPVGGWGEGVPLYLRIADAAAARPEARGCEGLRAL